VHPGDAERLRQLTETWEAAIADGVIEAWCVSRGRHGQWVLVVIEPDGVEHDGSGVTLPEAMIALAVAIQASALTTTLPDMLRAPPGERPN
jgi:hypothetical protein